MKVYVYESPSLEAAVAAYRQMREDGNLGPILERFGLDPAAIEADAAQLTAMEVTVAEAFVFAIVTTAIGQEAFPPKGMTRNPGPPKKAVRPGLRRRAWGS